MFELLRITVLGIVQGIAEFLPISSSGHIVVLNEVFRACDKQLGADIITLNIVLHLGTLAAILVVYRRRILALLTDDRRVIPLLIVGTIPAVVIGLTIKSQFESILDTPMLAGWMFLITAALLLTSTRLGGEKTCRSLGYRQALLIGLFQAFAILPGVSRSGSTIVAGLLCRMRRDEAATFSFLLAIPAIAGAGLLEAIDLIQDGGLGSTGASSLLLGFVLSFGVGVFALLWLIKWLNEGRLQLFAYWLLIIAPIVILWRFMAA